MAPLEVVVANVLGNLARDKNTHQDLPNHAGKQQ